FLGWQWIRLPGGLTVAEGVAHYEKLDSVLLAEPNRKVPLLRPPVEVVSDDRRLAPAGEEPPIIPDDPMFGRQWNLRKIGATNAWATTTGSTNVVVAVFDTGVDYTHPDLAPNMWRNPGESGLDAAGNDKATNRIDDDNNGYVDDLHGIDAVTGSGNPMDHGFKRDGSTIYHGTFVAGVIGAVGHNNLGVTGINWTTQIMALDVIDSDLTADPQTALQWEASTELVAWDYVLGMKRRGVNVRVISNSVALTAYSIAVQEAIAELSREGVLIVESVWMNSQDVDLYDIYWSLPSIPALIRVAYSDESDQPTTSNFGRGTVHLAAPGANIISTEPGGGYRTASGTSYSCPLVSGAAALLLAARPDLTLNQLKAALLGSVDQPAAFRGKMITGGRLNVGRAMQSLSAEDSKAIVVTSLPAGQRTRPNSAIQVAFSRPMNRDSVEAAFSTSPALSGEFEWSSDSDSFLFRPRVLLDRSTNYVVRILGTALDQSGQQLDGNFNRQREGSPDDDYTWGFRFPVLNDDFSDGQVLSGGSGRIGGTTRYTRLEPGEKLQERFYDEGGNPGTVWYRWTAPESEAWYTFDLAGASFDTYLAICTGTAVDNLVTIAKGDNYGSNRSSRVSFQASATNYFITVIAKNGSPGDTSGPFNLSWYPTPPPGFAGVEISPASGIPGARITLTGTNFTGATGVLFGGVAAHSFSNAPANNLDLRLSAEVPPGARSGPITVVTPYGNATTTASFQVLPPPLSLRFLSNGEVQLHWNATGDFFVVEHSRDLFDWQALEYPPEIGPEHSTLTLPFTFQRSGFFRLRTRPE
ncbi:MAG TPA: hypothetical protein DCE44_06895, partial [Verrucomicrobiales bacterium]|nr:hypothetical protein [Verrucomicrobiales bacterium]